MTTVTVVAFRSATYLPVPLELLVCARVDEILATSSSIYIYLIHRPVPNKDVL